MPALPAMIRSARSSVRARLVLPGSGAQRQRGGRMLSRKSRRALEREHEELRCVCKQLYSSLQGLYDADYRPKE